MIPFQPHPPRATRSPRLSGAPTKRRWRRWWLIVLGIICLPPLCLLSQLRPRQIICETTNHTYCPANIDEKLQRLRSVSWWRPEPIWKKIVAELRQSQPEITNLRWQRRWNITLQIWLEQADVLLAVQLPNNQTLALHTNGILTPQTEPNSSAAPLLFPQPDNWFIFVSDQWHWLPDVWTKALQQNLVAVSKGSSPSEQFSIHSIEVLAPQEVVLHLSTGQRIIIRIDEENAWTVQRNTLQAFFHSTTMNQTWQEIDVRFRNIVVR